MRYRPVFLVVLLMMLATLVAGCAATPRDDVARAERVYQAAAKAATIAVDADLVPASALDALSKASNEANQALADASARVRSGDELDAAFWSERALAAALRFAEVLAAVKEPGHGP